MTEIGSLHEDDQIELIEGEVMHKQSAGKSHCITDEYHRIGDRPPLQRRPHEDFYTEALPTPVDVFLLVEASDTTLQFDHDVRVPLYARAGVQEVMHRGSRRPQKAPFILTACGGLPRASLSVGRGDSLAPWTLSGLVVSVEDILG